MHTLACIVRFVFFFFALRILTVGRSGKRPAPETDVAVKLLAHVFALVHERIRGLASVGAQNLRLFKVLESAAQGERKLVPEARFDARLGGEGRVPALRAIVAGHFHAVFGHPQVVRHPEHVLLEVGVVDVGLAPLLPGDDQVHGFGDRANVHVISLQVFGVHVSHCKPLT